MGQTTLSVKQRWQFHYSSGSRCTVISRAIKKYGLHSFEVDRLFIKDSFRRKGIARNLFLELEKELRQQGCDHLTIYTDFENASSQQFYLQVGMSKTTIELWKKL